MVPALAVLSLFLAACGGAEDDTPADVEADTPADADTDGDVDTEDDAASEEVGDFSDVEERTYDAAFQQAPTGVHSEQLQWWTEEVTRRTDGKIKFELFWSGTLAKPSNLLSAIESGIAHMGDLASSYDPARTPLFQAVDLPYNATDYWCGLSVLPEMYRSDGPLRAEFEGNGVIPLTGYTSGTFHMLTAKPASGLSDIDGARMRTFNDSRGQMWARAGASPQFVALSDLYEALDRGVVDAAEWTVYLTEALSLYELVDSFGITDSGMVTGNPLVFDLDEWNDLPEKVRTVMLEVSAEHSERFAQAQIEIEEELLAKFEDEGVNVYELPDEDLETLRQHGEEAQEEWLDNMEAEGHGVREVWDNMQERMAACEADVEANGYPWEQ